MLYSNVAAGQTRVVRLMIGMFGLGVMAASVPGVAHTVLGDSDSVRPLNVFAIAYVARFVLRRPPAPTLLADTDQMIKQLGHDLRTGVLMFLTTNMRRGGAVVIAALIAAAAGAVPAQAWRWSKRAA